MSEALRLLETPGWLILFSLLIPVFAGFIKGVVEFSDNWPKFCRIVKPTANRLHYCLYGCWMEWFDHLSFILLGWLYGLSTASPDNDGPNGAPPVQARLRNIADQLSGNRRRAAPVLSVIEGGKTGTKEVLILLLSLGLAVSQALIGLVRRLHGGSANCTQSALLALFGTAIDAEVGAESVDNLLSKHSARWLTLHGSPISAKAYVGPPAVDNDQAVIAGTPFVRCIGLFAHTWNSFGCQFIRLADTVRVWLTTAKTTFAISIAQAAKNRPSLTPAF